MYAREIQGKGVPLLMLHGWGQSHEALLPLAELLTSVATPYLIDLPGFGKSEHPNQVWSAFDYADHLINYLDAKGIHQISLLGHSFGGKVSLCFAIRYPERVQRLIVLAPSGIPPRRSVKARLRMKALRIAGELLKGYDSLFRTNHFATTFSSRFGSRDYQSAGNMRPILVRSVNEDLSSQVGKIQCPSLLLWGKKDQETPLEIGERLACLIPHAKMVTFPYHDHYLFKDVGAHLCATYITSFLKEER